MSAPENPPAFPVRIESPLGAIDIKHGMSLRDWFAGQALIAVVNATSAGQHYPLVNDGLNLVQAMARDAFELADAMLAERAKGKP